MQLIDVWDYQVFIDWMDNGQVHIYNPNDGKWLCDCHSVEV